MFQKKKLLDIACTVIDQSLIICTMYCTVPVHCTCTLYTVHCTLYTVHCTLYTVHCTLYTVYCTLYTLYCILCTVHLPRSSDPFYIVSYYIKWANTSWTLLYKYAQYIMKIEIDFLGVLSKAIISTYSWSYGTSDSHKIKLILAYDNYFL